MEITQLYQNTALLVNNYTGQCYLPICHDCFELICPVRTLKLICPVRANVTRVGALMLLKAGFFSPHPWLRQSLINNCNGLYKEVGGLYSSWSLRANYLQASSMHGTQDMIVTTTLPFSPPSVKVGGHRRNSKLSPLKRNGWVPTHLCSGLFYFPFLITKRDLTLCSWEEHTTSFRLMAFTRQF